MPEETFAAEWLALREPVDHRSRSADLLGPLAEWWSARPSRRVLDLGSGTGSNLRYLAPRLPGEQRWTLVDQDTALLDRATGTAIDVVGVAGVERVSGDLEREGLALVAGADLVTASALLDLVTDEWLERLVEACRTAGSAALLSLTWDGGITWDDPNSDPGPDSRSDSHPDPDDVGSGDGHDDDQDEPTDRLVADAVRNHQLRDKGIGPALGPAAGPAAADAFRAAGYDTWLLPSPWRLGTGDELLTRALVDGWATAASEERPGDAPLIRDWAERRRPADLARFRLEVGHVDLLALPPETA
jgi:SAM-dependent methyltransferase